MYRYLREYSIPHVKKSGRISIPEESVEEIRRARDLHREGMGTTSVRRMLRESTDSVPVKQDEELSARLDRLARELEGLRGDPRSLEEASSPHALRTILARQSLLISAVFNLTGMVEELMRTGGSHRRSSPGSYVEPEAYEALEKISLIRNDIEGDYSGAPAVQNTRPETHLTRTRPMARPTGSPVVRVPNTSRSEFTANSPTDSRSTSDFGVLGRKRKRNTLMFAVAIAVVVLVLSSLTLAGAI